MASELQPWRYEIKYGPDGEDSYSWVYDDQGVMVAPMRTHKAKEVVDRMNTRPAAPVEGLETVGYADPEYITRRICHFTDDSVIREAETEVFNEALVTRSQAEELLAAERAKKNNFKRQAREHFDAFCALRNDINELVGDMPSLEGVMLEAGPEDAPQYQAVVEAVKHALAAKEARIKELDGECNELVTKCNEIIGQRDRDLNTCAQMEEDKEALEAKLAAAEKALAFYADPSKWNDGYFKSEDDGTVLRAYPSSIEKDHGDKARAVLKL